MQSFSQTRYESMVYNRCGRWGVKLPAVSLGAWQTYGGYVDDATSKRCLFRAFDLGITHFDFANNYGEPNGNAEVVCGKIIKEMPRNELLISTKAGFYMWPGPYGEWLSRKYLLSSLDDSLKRLQLDYVDIFYAHRPDPNTPTDEVMDALDQAVRSGKALYVGLSNHDAADTIAKNAHAVAYHTARPIINQVRYHMFERTVEQGTLQACAESGMGVIAYCPLAQGLLTDKYLESAKPADSRLSRSTDICAKRLGNRESIDKARKLNAIAQRRGQTLAQMAIVWLLRRPEMTSVLIGASRPEQIEENVAALKNAKFTDEELAEIEAILN
ncbi:MAG TPA: aldo/keto reductase [Phycisphaerae bacterium]|nr:aldo/keto reductase [Phycisphaerae bacterium]HON68911.1 aldo/keto reductase [Phycisphaerae bacterium]HPU24575.1 aldo/keto reductase [Phycisphaerae bacterium]HQE29485.1 aldo/keto reductase [Phycisphaerae bacterium]